MIEERFAIKLDNKMIEVIVKIINLNQYIKDIGGIMLSDYDY